MSRVQRFFKAIFPRRWEESMERESREWVARCGACGHERSIWELGGIRWKARGSPRRLLRCPQCRRPRWHRIVRR